MKKSKMIVHAPQVRGFVKHITDEKIKEFYGSDPAVTWEA